jgi:hypothetical protein
MSRASTTIHHHAASGSTTRSRIVEIRSGLKADSGRRGGSGTGGRRFGAVKSGTLLSGYAKSSTACDAREGEG